MLLGSAFFLSTRTDSVSLQDSYVFDDGDERTKKDKFQREPFIVRFRGHHSCKTGSFINLSPRVSRSLGREEERHWERGVRMTDWPIALWFYTAVFIPY